MTLDEYRRQALERLRACQDPSQARTVLAELECALTASRLSDYTVRLFWQGLSSDFEILVQESAYLLDKQALAVLAAVFSAAQAAIAQYQARLGSDKPPEGNSKASS
jgi:hypothetical protein